MASPRSADESSAPEPVVHPVWEAASTLTGFRECLWDMGLLGTISEVFRASTQTTNRGDVTDNESEGAY